MGRYAKGEFHVTRIEREAAQQAWEGLVADFHASGLSGPQWCAQTGWKLHQLRYWVAKLKLAAPAAGAEPTWVVLAPPATAPATLTVRVGAAELQVAAGFDPALLQAVVRTLATC